MEGNTVSAGDAIRAFLKRYNLEDKIREVKLQSVIRKVLGRELSKWVTKTSFRHGILNIEVNNSAVKQELGFHRSRIAEEINAEMGKKIVENVYIN